MRLRGVRLLSFAPSRAATDPYPVVDIDVDGGLIQAISPASRWNGGWVMPGLWDQHVHMEQWARAAHRLDLSAASTPTQVLRTVTDAASRHHAGMDGETLVGVGLWHSRWVQPFGTDGAPTQADLDRATGPLPTVLISADLHSAWLNSAAARLYGVGGREVGQARAARAVTQTEPARTAPSHASELAAPGATGLVAEEAWFSLMPLVTNEDLALTDAWVADAAAAAAARGVVGITDFEFADTIAAWERRVAGGFSALRVNAAVWPEHLDAAISSGYRTGDHLFQTLITMGPLKIIFDGSLNTRTAWCHHPYPDGTFGAANLSGEELRELISRAHAAGIHSAVHAIGDRANTHVLDAFEATGARGSVEHAQLLGPSEVARFAELSITASVQPAHLLDDRDVAEELWAGETHRAYPFASLARAGAVLRFGSDAPVAPLDPWLAIRAALTRTADSRPAWHASEILERAAALRASTARPSLTAGDPADLIMLGENPLAFPAADLTEIPVLLTVCGGRVTHES